MIDLTPVFSAVLALASALITAFFIPWLKSVTNGQQREELASWVELAVRAAEQIFTGSGRGEEKKQYVVQYLSERGYKVDFDTLNILIEAAVQKLNEEIKEA